MESINPCPRCGNKVELETIQLFDMSNPSFGLYKYILKCEKCGFEKRRNGKKNKHKLIEEWNNTHLKRWGTCDTCGRPICYKDKIIHTDAGDHFCSLKCYNEREKYYHAEAEYEIAR